MLYSFSAIMTCQKVQCYGSGSTFVDASYALSLSDNILEGRFRLSHIDSMKNKDREYLFKVV